MAASRASTHGSRSSPARKSVSVNCFAASIPIGFGKVFGTFGARTAASAPTLPLPLRSRKRANDRAPARERISAARGRGGGGGGGGGADAASAPRRHEGAHVARFDGSERRERDRFT